MYSDKAHINILTAAFAAYGIEHVVVCPGSRNAPLVHNFNEHPRIKCHPVTDERSAGFVALGMRLCLDSPVVVCVTSGSALLNLLPAVAEATYQHQGIIVVSADRPAEWINQLDGQTLPQKNALGGFVECSVTLSEIPSTLSESDKSRQCWYCRRMIGEALAKNRHPHRPSVHINVALSEPLFTFTAPTLPDVSPIAYSFPAISRAWAKEEVFERLFGRDCRTMLICGQMRYSEENFSVLQAISRRVPVVCEPLSWKTTMVDGMFAAAQAMENISPDAILYVGGHIVSKRLKQYVRKGHAQVWAAGEDGEIHDVFQKQTHLLHCNGMELLRLLKTYCEQRCDAPLVDGGFFQQWESLRLRSLSLAERRVTVFSQAMAVQCLEEYLPSGSIVHYANSTSIRLACTYSRHYVWCNRGLNGIEGTLSTAVGHSLSTAESVFCVIGDLSFFYDENALWNKTLGGNLRILLLNNGRGGIFHQLPGLEASGALDEYVAARHEATAEYICRQFNINYRCACDPSQMEEAVKALIDSRSERPMLVEVRTQINNDTTAYQALLKHYEELENN